MCEKEVVDEVLVLLLVVLDDEVEVDEVKVDEVLVDEGLSVSFRVVLDSAR